MPRNKFKDVEKLRSPSPANEKANDAYGNTSLHEQATDEDMDDLLLVWEKISAMKTQRRSSFFFISVADMYTCAHAHTEQNERVTKSKRESEKEEKMRKYQLSSSDSSAN